MVIRRPPLIITLLSTFNLLLVAATYAAVIHVPGDQPTIQEGVEVSVAGDTVLVAPGVYPGAGNHDITIVGPGIVIRSEEGAASTVIDCEGNPQAFCVESSWPNIVIEGFSITNATQTAVAGWFIDSPLQVAACAFRHNMLAVDLQVSPSPIRSRK
jgi:hypothetical protein